MEKGRLTTRQRAFRSTLERPVLAPACEPKRAPWGNRVHTTAEVALLHVRGDLGFLLARDLPKTFRCSSPFLLTVHQREPKRVWM